MIKPSDNFVSLLSQLRSSIDNINEALMSAPDNVDYDSLSQKDKVRHDLFLVYSLKGLLWLYMRAKGEDPSQTVIKTELNLVKQYMSELQWLIDRVTFMPRIDQGAAKRFVRHGLWELGVEQPDEDVTKHA